MWDFSLIEEDEKEQPFIAEFWNKDQSDSSIIHIRKYFLQGHMILLIALSEQIWFFPLISFQDSWV